MSNRNLLLLPAIAASLLLSCAPNDIPDLGQGFETHALYAPWDGLQNDTRFCCHSTDDSFFFSFEVTDSTITLTEPFIDESSIGPEDRVEVFFCPAEGMEAGYYGAEIDPCGRIMDYRAVFYRQFDYEWNFSTMKTVTEFTPLGYRVAGSVSRTELEALGIDLENGFRIGIFQADFRPDGSVNWYSLIQTDDESADFHKPDVLFDCRMTPKVGKRGVVVYPNDITTVGLE